jgi:hypothetical protein
MTNCLFAHGIHAFTAELKVRFLLPVTVRGVIRLKANIEKSYAHFYMLKAELLQNHALKARASGKFASFSKIEVAKQKPRKKSLRLIPKVQKKGP